jgi:hypothetical protein
MVCITVVVAVVDIFMIGSVEKESLKCNEHGSKFSPVITINQYLFS